MDGVVNEVTNTVHKHETGKSRLQTECGVTYHLSADDLHVVRVVQSELDGKCASKCGRCFDDAGGY
jgi:hypothetical protein